MQKSLKKKWYSSARPWQALSSTARTYSGAAQHRKRRLGRHAPQEFVNLSPPPARHVVEPSADGLLHVLEGVAPLAPAGFDHREAASNEEVPAALAGGAGDLALDDDGAQRAFGVIVRRSHVGVVQEGPQRSPGFEQVRAGGRGAEARRLFGALLQGASSAALQRFEFLR